MAVIGYTRGGSPIFWPDNGTKPTRTTGQRNKRFACEACTAKTTKNQLKANGGVCHACKAPITGSSANTIAELTKAVEATKAEGLGGKVMIPLDVAEAVLALVKR